MVVQASHAPSFQMVLGAFTKRTSAGSNWNEILDNGAYAVSNATTATGAPSGAYGWGTLVVTTSRDMGSYCGIVQLYFENTDEGIVWQRSKWLNTDEFRSWTKIITNIPSFYKDYANLDALILGVKGLAILNQASKTSGSVGDFNTFGATFIGNSQETPIEDRPSSASSIIIPIPAANGFKAQLAFDNDGKWYVRSMGWNRIWTAWKTIVS